jgi:hypothetical protein
MCLSVYVCCVRVFELMGVKPIATEPDCGVCNAAYSEATQPSTVYPKKFLIPNS